MARFHQGRFTPKNPEKYVGDVNNIIYRSSWELKFMQWADSNPQVLKYGSEELVIPYFNESDQRVHRYFPDFIIMVRNNSNQIKKYVVEIKPEAQVLEPKPPAKRTKRTEQRFLNEVLTYSKNQCKWRAADQFCQKNGMEFLILTEKHLKV